MGVCGNGNRPVFKTGAAGSSPAAPANLNFYTMENTNYVQEVMTASTSPSLVLNNNQECKYCADDYVREPDSYIRMTISVRKAAKIQTEEDFRLLTEVLQKFNDNSFEITESSLSKNSW